MTMILHIQREPVSDELKKKLAGIWKKSTKEQRTKFLRNHNIGPTNMDLENKSWSKLPADMKDRIYNSWTKNVKPLF